MTIHYDRETLIDYLHGELGEDADAAVFAHLESCSACTAVHNEEAAFGEALRSAARTSELEFPSTVKARVWDAIRNQQPSWLDRLRLWGPRAAVPVAAAIALAAYLGSPVWKHPVQASGIEAAYYLDAHNAEAQQNPFGPGASPAVYTSAETTTNGNAPTAASYIDTADAAILVDASGAYR